MISTDSRGVRQRCVLGLLGGVCSGKTTVASVLEQHGFVRLDADRIAHAWLDDARIRGELQRLFGDGVLAGDGSVDRRALADVVFEDPARLEQLNALIHPPVVEEMERRIAATDRPVVVDAALLVESGLDARVCTHLLFVEKPFRERVRLAMERRGWSRRELQRRETMQRPLEDKRAMADFIVNNTGSIADLDAGVRDILRRLA